MNSYQTGPAISLAAGKAIAFTIAAAVVGFVMFIVYSLSIQPILTDCQGGASDSFGAAALIGVALVIGGLILTVRLRRALLPFVLFVGLYTVSLIVLAEVSPLIWGQITCSDEGLF
jgi:hypothetical protein